MKHLGKLAVLGAVLAASSSFAFATTYTIGSYSTTGSAGVDSNTALTLAGVDLTGGMPTTLGTLSAPTSPLSSTTYTLSPGTVWAAALNNSTWVGATAAAGPGGTNPLYGYYDFQTTLNGITAGSYLLNLNLLADDTVEVILNGNTTTPLVPFGVLGNDNQCSQNPTGCLTSTETNLVTSVNLGVNNTLDFIVEQAGNQAVGLDPSGVDFDGTLANGQAPEPSSLMLLGTGLMGAAGMLFRRRQQASV